MDRAQELIAFSSAYTMQLKIVSSMQSNLGALEVEVRSLVTTPNTIAHIQRMEEALDAARAAIKLKKVETIDVTIQAQLDEANQAAGGAPLAGAPLFPPTGKLGGGQDSGPQQGGSGGGNAYGYDQHPQYGAGSGYGDGGGNGGTGSSGFGPGSCGYYGGQSGSGGAALSKTTQLGSKSKPVDGKASGGNDSRSTVLNPSQSVLNLPLRPASSTTNIKASASIPRSGPQRKGNPPDKSGPTPFRKSAESIPADDSDKASRSSTPALAGGPVDSLPNPEKGKQSKTAYTKDVPYQGSNKSQTSFKSNRSNGSGNGPDGRKPGKRGALPGLPKP